MFDIKENLKKLPDRPGVYIHKDGLGEVIYVGKAVSLKNRVRQYFQSDKGKDAKVRAMVKNISEFEYIVTDTEMEALILECNLIKKYRPKYNVLLRDDKSYPYIKLTTNEKWPRVIKTRQVKNDGAKYFGPYTDVNAVNSIVDFLNGFLKLKGCSRMKFTEGSRPCLNYHIGKCHGLCSLSEEDEKSILDEYKKSIDMAVAFLAGRSKELIDILTADMKTAAADFEFEEAAALRDKINALQALGHKQSVVKLEAGDIDVLLSIKSKNQVYVVLFFVRDGKLTGRESFKMQTEFQNEDDAFVEEFINQYYVSEEMIPTEILVKEEINERELIEGRLATIKGKKVSVQVPKRGHKRALLELAIKDSILLASSIEDRELHRQERDRKLKEQLTDILGFEVSRIEAYDISNISGADSVGAMVVFENGVPVKKDFRKFKIRTVEGANDFASMQEVIYRRFKRYMDGDKAFNKLPDVIFMDGGKPQISAAYEVLSAMKINLPVVGMVKDDFHRTRGLIWNGEEYSLQKLPLLFKFVTSIQDRVHDFAIDYHTDIRNKSMEKSILDDIRGIGTVKKSNLIRSFDSVEDIRTASIERLLQVDGITRQNAEEIRRFFDENKNQTT